MRSEVLVFAKRLEEIAQDDTLSFDNSAPAAPVRTTYRRRTTRRRRSMFSRGRYGYRRSRFSRRRYGYRRRSAMNAIRLHQMHKFVRAQINPFDANVIGVKIPDSNTYPSSPIKIEDAFSGVMTDANGLKALAFIPMLKNNVILHTPATSASWTWAAAYAGGSDSGRSAAVKAQFSLVRPVAHGLRVTCSGAPTAITGNLHVAIVAQSDFGKTTWNFPTSLSEMSNCMFYKKYPLAQFTQQGLTIVNKFLDCTSTKYIDPASDGIDNSTDVGFQTNGWATILVVVEGAPVTTSVLSIEEVLHMEAIPLVTGLDTSSPAAAFDVGVQQTVSRMAGQVPAAYADTDEQSYLQEVAATIGGGISRGASNFYRNAFLPAVGRAAYAGVGYAVNRAFGLPGVTNFRNPSAFQTLTF